MSISGLHTIVDSMLYAVDNTFFAASCLESHAPGILFFGSYHVPSVEDIVSEVLHLHTEYKLMRTSENGLKDRKSYLTSLFKSIDPRLIHGIRDENPEMMKWVKNKHRDLIEPQHEGDMYLTIKFAYVFPDEVEEEMRGGMTLEDAYWSFFENGSNQWTFDILCDENGEIPSKEEMHVFFKYRAVHDPDGSRLFPLSLYGESEDVYIQLDQTINRMPTSFSPRKAYQLDSYTLHCVLEEILYDLSMSKSLIRKMDLNDKKSKIVTLFPPLHRKLTRLIDKKSSMGKLITFPSHTSSLHYDTKGTTEN